MKEPTPDRLGGNAPGRVAKRLLLATRPQFLQASLLSVVLGTAWGARAAGDFDRVAFALMLIAVALAHSSGNVLNDVGDALSGGDQRNTARIYPFTGGSRFIQNGVMSVRGMTVWGAVLLAAAALAAAALIAGKGVEVLWLGLAGLGLGAVYSLPVLWPGRWGAELACVCLGFGALPVAGSAWLQSGRWEGEAALIGLAAGIWVAMILLANEVPDAEADVAAGKLTLASGLAGAGRGTIYLAFYLAALAALAPLVAAGAVPAAALIVPALGLAVAVSAARGVAAGLTDAPRLVRAIKGTIALHAANTSWLALWVWL